jgi:hypothetical protein
MLIVFSFLFIILQGFQLCNASVYLPLRASPFPHHAPKKVMAAQGNWCPSGGFLSSCGGRQTVTALLRASSVPKEGATEMACPPGLGHGEQIYFPVIE